MDRQTAEGAALLEWFNSVLLSEKAATLESLNDGHSIWGVLHDIDSQHFDGDLPEGPSNSGKWLARWQNLKHISRALFIYVTDVCQQNLPSGIDTMDLKLIATDASYGEIVKAGLQIRGVGSRRANFTPQLLKLVLITSIHSSNAEKYITKMISLSTSTQEKLKEIIIDLQSSEPVSEAEIYPEDSVSSPVNPTFDLELAFEERISQIMADNENLAQDKRELQKDLRDLHNRLERLQENNDTLQGRLTKAEDALQLNGSANGPQGSWAKQLETKIQQQEDVIANQEVRLADYQSSLESSEKTVEKLRRGSDKTQKLRDELDEIKTERDNLSRKANTIDKYKQKLQTSQNLEKENQALRGELDEIRQQFREVEQVRSKVSGFQLTIAEYQRILPKIEQEQHELQMMKKHLELDNATLAERWGKANEQHARDQETIADLSDRLQDLDGMRTPSHQRTGGLEEELEEGKQNEDKMRVAKTCLMWTRLTLSNRIQHLKAKNQQLSQDNDETKSRNVMLEQMRNDTEKKYEVMKQQQSDTYEQKLLLENALASVRDGHPIQTTEVFTTMRDQLKTEQQKSQDLQDELADAKRKLQDTQDDRTRFQDLYCRLFEEPANDVSVSVVDKDKLDVLEEAKTRYSPAVDNVQSENERLRKNLKDIEMDLEEHKQMLRKALGEIDSLQETGSSRKDVKSTLEDIKAALSENGGNPNFALDKRISELFDKVTDERGVLIEKEELIKKRDARISELEHRLKQAEPMNASSAAQEPVDQAALQEENENLRRETRLMASALFDIGSRFQMNNVSLQRRSEPLRSSLNQQRQRVNQVTGIKIR